MRVYFRAMALPDLNSTIVALSTAPGVGAIAVVRLSGPEAIAVASKVFSAVGKKKLADLPSHTAHFGVINDGDSALDEVVTTLFRAPKTYTGQDVVEISCHGSLFIQQRLVELLIENGARLAGPGEFTLRAFLSGRLSLAQAEAVADLIASESGAQHRMAMNQMRGGYTEALRSLRQELVDFVALIELELDFSEEDVEFADRTRLINLLDLIKQKVDSLLRSFKEGNAIKTGIPIVIAGRPNAGKSTLLNALLNEDRAIVSDIAGTTRDVIEDQLVIDGIPFRLMDTAGLRESDDQIEKAGIERSFDRMGKGTLVIYLFDQNTVAAHEVQTDLEQLRAINPNILPVANKVDLIENEPWATPSAIPEGTIFISAKQGQNLEALRHAMVERAVKSPEVATGSVTLSNVRHFEALEKASAHLAASRQGLLSGLSGEFVSFDLRQVLEHLGAITGEVTTDDLLGSIFSRFCIGK